MASVAQMMKQFKDLEKKRARIENEIKELNDVLISQKEVGMSGALVDTEGFPRADIDIYSVRHARHDIICKNNDLKVIMNEIEELLYQIHSAAREEKSTETQMEVRTTREEEILFPFATVDRIEDGSPASTSGLQVGDEIVQFGSVKTNNFKGLKDIADIVQHSKGMPLSIAVLRQGQLIHVGLTPRTWSGRGLLGCNIVPKNR